MADQNVNPALTSFLVGKFSRGSIREVLEGTTIADISGMDMSDFMACLSEKDRIIGARLWAEVILPIRNAWSSFKMVEPHYLAAQTQLTERITAIRARLAPPAAPAPAPAPQNN